MSAIAFDTVLHEALALPFDQRSFLATQLIASLDEDDLVAALAFAQPPS
jgi:hypothetical protein